MTSIEKPLLVTTINPFANVPHQLKCFNQWKALGFDVLSVNVEQEARLLRSEGIPDANIRLIDDSETGAELFGKTVPLIKPIIDFLRNDKQHTHFIISNSDIYPAVRSTSIVRFWECAANQCLALTREECHALDDYSFIDQAPYRGGLDTFFMSQDALNLVGQELDTLTASKRMAFGIPGWDYLLGATILSSRVGGTIADSGTLLHVSHKPSYGAIDEFGHYLPDMVSLGMTEANNASAAAADFAERINAECFANKDIAEKARLIYFNPIQASTEESSGENSLEKYQNLLSVVPQFEGQYRKKALRSLLNRLCTDPQANFAMALNFLVRSPSKLYSFAQVLFAIALALRCKPGAFPTELVEHYPEGNQHAAALNNIVDRIPESDPSRRLEVAKLFGSELIDHRIFNPRLYNYLVLCSANRMERALLSDIGEMTRRKKHAA